jgi:hypothetical protein
MLTKVAGATECLTNLLRPCRLLRRAGYSPNERALTDQKQQLKNIISPSDAATTPSVE